MKNRFISTLEKIKQRGFWEIQFLPIKEKPISLKPPQLKKMIKDCRVMLRGWDYPHYPEVSNEIQDIYWDSKENSIKSWTDWGAYKECWQFYKNRKFLHFLAVHEDWLEEEDRFWRSAGLEKVKPGEIISIIGIIYFFTEIFEFLKNLTNKNIYERELNIVITLFNTYGRRLEVLDPMRAPLLGKYWSREERIKIEKKHSTREIKENSQKIAKDWIEEFFHNFQWDNPPLDLIEKEQNKLLERKL